MDGPVRYLVVAPQFSNLVAWLKCNDVEPRDVPLKTEVFVETDAGGQWVIRHSVYARTAAGIIVYDPVTLIFATEWRSVPLVNDPPMSWLKDVSPAPVHATDAWLPGFNVD